MNTEKQTEKFKCPYCGKVKDISEKNYKTEYSNFQPTTEKLGDIRDIYHYKHITFKYTQYEVPICDDCLIIHNEAGFKANIIALCTFLPVAIYILTQSMAENIVLIGFIGIIICIIIRWIVKGFLVERKGIRNKGYDNIGYTKYDYLLNQFMTSGQRNEEEIKELEKKLSEEKRNRELEMRKKEAEEMKIKRNLNYIAEWNKTHNNDNNNTDIVSNKRENIKTNYEDENYGEHIN